MTQLELTIAGRRPPEPGPLRLIATLTLAGALSGLALAAVYQVTRPVVEANRQRALERAVFDVVPGAVTMQRLDLRDGRLAPGAGDDHGDGSVYAAYGEHEAFLGWAVEGEGAGYQDTIRLLYGYAPRETKIIGIYVLESRETPGLGDQIYKNDAFVENFKALAAEPEIVLVKTGRAADNEVDAITGATISSGAVVRILNEAHARWKDVLRDTPPPAPPAAESPLEPAPPAAPSSTQAKRRQGRRRRSRRLQAEGRSMTPSFVARARRGPTEGDVGAGWSKPQDAAPPEPPSRLADASAGASAGPEGARPSHSPGRKPQDTAPPEPAEAWP